MIWKLNSTAQSSSTQSLASMFPKPFFMHSRYSPATAMTTLSHSRGLPRRPRARPNTGTSTTYMAVRNPALAVEGFRVMPYCWAVEATNSRVPHKRLALFSSRRSCSVWGALVRPVCRRLTRSKTFTVGTSTSTASQLRPARKLQAPMPAPALWATKAVPQIKAHSSSKSEFFRCVVISQRPPPSAGHKDSTGWNHRKR